MIAWLLKTSGGEPGEIHVAIETPHGPIVEALLERGFNVYSINPKQLERFRDRFTVAGAKDDSLDAYVLADSLRTDMPLFRKLSVAEPLIAPAKRVDIPKASGGTRPLGIPTVADRVAHEVVRRYLEPILEPEFHPDQR